MSFSKTFNWLGWHVSKRLEPETRHKRKRSLRQSAISRILKGMEVQFTPDVEKKLNDLATQSGRGASEVLQDALT
ncbi:MAG: hypothetical protein ACRD4O_13185, partial [Bryobacteraceae bacterium]